MSNGFAVNATVNDIECPHIVVEYEFKGGMGHEMQMAVR